MKLTVKRRIEEEVEAKHLVVIVPHDEVEYEDCYEGAGRVPATFRTDHGYQFRVDLATGRIVGWPEGLSVDAHYKPRDGGTYQICDANDAVIYEWVDCYVPGFLDHNDGGDDYLDFKISPDGTWLGLRIDGDRVSRSFREDD